MIQLDMFLALSVHKEISMDSMNLLMLCDNEILLKFKLSLSHRGESLSIFTFERFSLSVMRSFE